jgi:two-component system, NtrC family, sensor kinase
MMGGSELQSVLTEILEATVDFVGLSDAQGNVLYVNKAGRLMAGFEPSEDVTRLSVNDFLPAYEAERFAQEIMPVLIEQGIWQGKVELIDRQGRILPLSDVLMAHRSADGEVQYLSVIGRDISEQQALALDLQESHARFQGLVETISDWIWEIDPKGHYTYVSPQVESILGYPTQQMLGRSLFEFMAPDEGEQAWTIFAHKLSTQTALEQLETLHKHPKGQVVVLETSGVPFFDAHGRLKGYRGVTRNITDRKAAEAALKEYANSQTLLNQLATQIRQSLDLDTVIATALHAIQASLEIDQCCFAWFRLENDPTSWEIVQAACAPGMPELLGHYPANEVGRLVTTKLMRQEMICIPDAQDWDDEDFRGLLRTLGIKSTVLWPIITRIGEMGCLICNFFQKQHTWSNNELEILQAVIDQLAIAIDQAQLYTQSLTQAKALAKTLQELQQAQAHMIHAEKMSSLGQLVAGVAHEINNPVSFIHGNLTPASQYAQDLLRLVSLYQTNYPEPTTDIQTVIEEIDLPFLQEDFPQLLDSMNMGTQRIREIVLSLRNFSRLDEAEIKAVSLHEGIESTLVILGNRLKGIDGGAAIEIIRDYDSTLPLVECYPGQLNQVFMNILSNAIDALEKITYPTITLRTWATPEWVTAVISDNGPGMSEQVQAQIFNPFFTTKPVGKGTGMGMSISYQIITEKHAGKLSCVSVPDQGTDFIVRIPIKQENAPS